MFGINRHKPRHRTDLVFKCSETADASAVLPRNHWGIDGQYKRKLGMGSEQNTGAAADGGAAAARVTGGGGASGSGADTAVAGPSNTAVAGPSREPRNKKTKTGHADDMEFDNSWPDSPGR